MVAVGEPVYNTEQRREMLRQLKEHLDNEWLKRKAAGKLLKKKIILPGGEPIKTKAKRKRKRKRRVRLFKVIQATKYGDHIVLKEVKRIKRKNRKYKK